MEHVIKDRYALYNGDCVEVMAGLPDNSIDYSVYSPPFSSLYIYSDSERDMGNSENDEEFFKHYRYAIRQKLRITKPGRLSTIHVKDLVYYSNASERGDRGLKDFPGECIRAHVEEGWTYHSRHVVGRCPVREMTKSKPDGLLYKNFRKDAARVRDERHLCPLQLDVIDRALILWSNPGDVVLSPFLGIGSEGVQSIKHRRRFIGIELKRSYFDQAVRNLGSAEASAPSLLDALEVA
jgi:DNA modification methylase